MFNPHNQSFLQKRSVKTAWCAAHVQHLLDKCQYISTNIPKTVDDIILQELPMSVRMSGHILYGVARIYSKKLDYLSFDYNLLRTLVAKPEDLRQAPFDFITLPQTLNLDKLDLEDDTLDMEFDNHIESKEDINHTDQIPTGIDPYVAITFNDEDMVSESNRMDIYQFTVPGRGNLRENDVEMAYEAGPNNELGDVNVATTHCHRNDTEELPEFQVPRPSTKRSNANSPGSVPEIEKRRDASHDLSPMSHPPFAAQQQNVRVEGTESLDKTWNEKEPTIPSIDEEVLNYSRGHSTFELPLGSPGFAGSEEERANFVYPSPELSLQPTTPPPPPQTRPRKRKYFDKATVLSNKIMRKRLEDPGNTHRKRKKLPSSKLGFGRLNNQSKKDQLFNEPLFTGFSDVLRSVFEKGCVALNPHLAVTDETFPETASVPASSPIGEAETEINPASPIPQSTVPDSTNLDSTVQWSPGQQTEDVQGVACPQSTHVESVAAEAKSPQSFSNTDIGIEHFRDGGFPNYMPSPPPRSSPLRTDEFTSQPGTWEIGSCRTKPSTSTNPKDLPGLNIPEYMPSPPLRSSRFRNNDFTTQPETWETGSYRTKPSMLMSRSDLSRTEMTDLPLSSIYNFNSTCGLLLTSSLLGREVVGLGLVEVQAQHSTSTNPEDLPGLNIPEYMPSPPRRSSPFRTNDFTIQPETWEKGSYRTEASTSTNLPGLRNLGLSPNPETADEELSFLEVDDNTPLRSPVTQDSDGLSRRTRALAQHLKERCSSSPTSSHTSGDLSLNKILEGKTRKIAARMFYDTLVLKSRGLIDMKQDQPYSDITLKLMPALSSKAQL